MNWYAQKRQEFIRETIGIYGFINRRHIQRKFGCSNVQAGMDLTLFAKNNPNLARYDRHEKCYVAHSEVRT